MDAWNGLLTGSPGPKEVQLPKIEMKRFTLEFAPDSNPYAETKDLPETPKKCHGNVTE